MIYEFAIDIPSTARREVIDAELLRCLRERFPEARAWRMTPGAELDVSVVGDELTKLSAWKDE